MGTTTTMAEKVTTTIQETTTVVVEAISTTLDNADIVEVTSQIVENTIERGFSLWNFISNASDFANIILAMVASFITIWAFGKEHISRKVRFLDWSCGCGMYDGYTITVTLQSKCLSTLSIRRVDLIADEEEIVLKSINCCGKQDNKPIVIEPYKTISIISDGSITPLLEKNSLGEYNNIELRLIFFDGKVKKVKFKSPKDFPTSKNMKRSSRKYIEGVLCTQYLWYVVKVINPQGDISIYPIYGSGINRHGSFSKTFYNIDHVSSSVLENEDTVKSFFYNIIDDKRYIVEVLKNDNFIGAKNENTLKQVGK